MIKTGILLWRLFIQLSYRHPAYLPLIFKDCIFTRKNLLFLYYNFWATTASIWRYPHFVSMQWLNSFRNLCWSFSSLSPSTGALTFIVPFTPSIQLQAIFLATLLPVAKETIVSKLPFHLFIGVINTLLVSIDADFVSIILMLPASLNSLSNSIPIRGFWPFASQIVITMKKKKIYKWHDHFFASQCTYTLIPPYKRCRHALLLDSLVPSSVLDLLA